jgi:hypothetical protein
MPVSESPTPGCVKWIGFRPKGGCFGKTAIVDLEIRGASDCLSVQVNNCNGGVLKIYNTCTEIFLIEKIEIPPDGLMTLDLRENYKGVVELFRTSGNFSGYAPVEDQHMIFNGTIGDGVVGVSFTRTRLLCD